MIYLDNFTFPDKDDEWKFFMTQPLTCYDTHYPFQVLAPRGLERLDFEPVTILCGGNGCGKTTALNIIAEKIGAERRCVYNRSPFFETYTSLCRSVDGDGLPEKKVIITSDDVFDYMLNLRHINDGVDNDREKLFEDYRELKNSDFHMRSLDDYDKLVRVNSAKRKTMSKFARKENAENIRERSNGETAFKHFLESIDDNGLYLLDEPENSLSAARQIELKSVIEDYAAYCGCQFIISTHSPFLLSIKKAKIYDLDEDPPDIKKWTELKNVRLYYDFFSAASDEFNDEDED